MFQAWGGVHEGLCHAAVVRKQGWELERGVQPGCGVKGRSDGDVQHVSGSGFHPEQSCEAPASPVSSGVIRCHQVKR